MLSRISQSLSGRLLLTALIFLALFLGLTGYVLDRAFQNSVETALLERLKTHSYTLLAAANDDNGHLKMPDLLQDPGFNQLNSGLYGFIYDGKGEEVWRSPSALPLKVKFNSAMPSGEYQLNKVSAIDEGELYVFSYGIIWENETGKETSYSFNVLHNNAPVIAEIRGFRTTLWRWLGGIGILLLLTLGGIMHWGLSPLRKLAADLHEIEEGHQEQLTGHYPIELRGVTRNLNVLINNERRQRSRYRNTLADLAHSLKTPLAILRGSSTSPEKSNSEDKILIDEQISRMDEIITYQLQRATTPDISIAAKGVLLDTVAQKVIRTLSKVYSGKQVSSTVNIPQQSLFFGDERDLMEVLGNLLDNAFKSCSRQVTIKAESPSEYNPEKQLIIHIEDDGPGIPLEKRKTVLERGIRADTKTPGQGIGLAVSLDIINSYKGSINIETSSLGGAHFIITFPQ